MYLIFKEKDDGTGQAPKPFDGTTSTGAEMAEKTNRRHIFFIASAVKAASVLMCYFPPTLRAPHVVCKPQMKSV